MMQLQLRKIIEKRKDRIRELMNELYFGDAQREKLAPLLESGIRISSYKGITVSDTELL
jgi:hypothetical protein